MTPTPSPQPELADPLDRLAAFAPPPVVDADTQLRQTLNALLTPLAARQVTAREAYAAMTRVVARLEGDVPTGARLVSLLQGFNAQRPAQVPAIPAGTAGVAQDSVAVYRRGLVRAASQGVAHAALPPDLLDSLNGWLERLVELMKEDLRRGYDAEAARLRADCDAALAREQAQAQADRDAARAAQDQLQAELQDRQRQIQSLGDEQARQRERIDALTQALDRAAREQRELAARAAVLESRAMEGAAREAQQRQALSAAQAAADEERRQRLLALDGARVVEQELAREKERRKAADALTRAMEHYLEEEKARAAALQAALTELQQADQRQRAADAEAARLGQIQAQAALQAAQARAAARLKPIRPAATSAPRRKSLR